MNSASEIIIQKIKTMDKKKQNNRILTILALMLCISIVLNIYQYLTPKKIIQAHKGTFDSSVGDRLTGAYSETFICSGDKTEKTVDILFIGNSYTLHDYADFWWGKWGMAASAKENDFVHKTAEGLATDSNVHFTALNYSIWEKMSSYREATFPIIDSYIDSDLDYVVIELGENVENFTNYQVDLSGLLTHIKEGAPKAQILVVGATARPDVDNMKKAACESAGAIFVDVSNITDWQCGLGTVVLGEDGKEHTVEHEGVASHPGDNGHKQIAERILAAMIR